MKQLFRNLLLAFLYPRPLVGIFYLPKFIKNYFLYKKNSTSEKINVLDTYPCLLDDVIATPFDQHYFYQGVWFARKLSKYKAGLHVDIGSSVMMISVISAITKTLFVDYRPLQVNVDNLVSLGANITNLPFANNSLETVSSLSVIEHIGLGRYGDEIDSGGTVKAAKEIERTLKVGGLLFLTLPVGKEKVCFNAHRIFAPKTVLSMFDSMQLIEFSYVNDAGEYVVGGDLQSVENNNFACGMYILEKV